MAESKTVFKWWWGWNVSKLERWLEEQEAKGWNLVRVSDAGVLFTFTKGASRRMAYRVDFQVQADDHYAQLFEDAGWSLAGSGSGWYYWRCEYDGERPEIFTDVESLIGRNRRQMLLLGVLLVSELVIMNTVLSGAHGHWTRGLAGVLFVIIIVLVFALFRFAVANRRLKTQL